VTKRIAIVGSREYPHLEFVDHYVSTLHTSVTVISGGALGVDQRAEARARIRGIAVEVIEPDYAGYGRKVAPIMRNTTIAARCDQMVAFWAHTMGTADAVAKAHRRGKHVTVFDEAGNQVDPREVVRWLNQQRRRTPA